MATIKQRLEALERSDKSPDFDLEYFFACLFRHPGQDAPVRSAKPGLSVEQYFQKLMATRDNG